MKGTISFALLEKEMVHEMRNTINTAEDTIDLEKQFSNIMKHLLARVLDKQHIPAKVHDDDVIFNPEAGDFYNISGELKKTAGVGELLASSDLKSIMGRFAASVHRKYLHLTRRREKARFKIR